MEQNILAGILALIGVAGFLIGLKFLSKISKFKKTATPVRLKVTKIVNTVVDMDKSGTDRPIFEVIAGPYKGITGSALFGTTINSDKVDDEVDGFYAEDTQTMESENTLKSYGFIFKQSLIFSPLFITAGVYLLLNPGLI